MSSLTKTAFLFRSKKPNSFVCQGVFERHPEPPCPVAQIRQREACYFLQQFGSPARQAAGGVLCPRATAKNANVVPVKNGVHGVRMPGSKPCFFLIPGPVSRTVRRRKNRNDMDDLRFHLSIKFIWLWFQLGDGGS